MFWLLIVVGTTILCYFVAVLHYILAAHRRSYVTRKWVRRCRKEHNRVKPNKCSRLPTLCAISKVGVLYCFAVHGSNLLWQVIKIIRHLQASLSILSTQTHGLQKYNLQTRRGHSHNTTNIYNLAGYIFVTHERREHKHSCAHTCSTSFRIIKM